MGIGGINMTKLGLALGIAVGAAMVVSGLFALAGSQVGYLLFSTSAASLGVGGFLVAQRRYGGP
jgi:hypothetical protein